MDNDKGFIPKEDMEFEKEQRLLEEKRAQLEEQSLLERELQRKADIKARNKQADKDRIELVKLKQGITDETETELIKEPPVIEKPKGKKAVENFFYHHKWHVIVITFFVIFIVAFAYDLLSKVDPDVRIIVFSDNELADKTDELSKYFEQFAQDFNGDGKVYVEVSSIPITKTSGNAMMDLSNQTKLAAEIQSAEAMLFITDSEVDVEYPPEGLFMSKEELAELYSDNTSILDWGFTFDNDSLKEAVGIEIFPDNMYLAIRYQTNVPGVSQKDFMKSWNNAKTFLDKYVEGTH